MTHRPPRVRQRLLLSTLTACMALGGGSVAAQSASPAHVGPAAPPPAVSPAADASPAASATLEAELAAARARIASLEQQSRRIDDLLDAFDDMYDGMEAERQLMIELRKPIPDQRDGAEAYLARLSRLAIVSDPVHLGQPASRLLETAPVYLDWRDGSYASPVERDAAFIESGAAGFSNDLDDLEKAVLLAVSNRLDALLNLRDRIR